MIPPHPWAIAGLNARQYSGRAAAGWSAGFYGFFAGPNVHLVERHGLSDFMLARMPYCWTRKWRPGHLVRPIPDGYIKSIEQNENLLTDEKLSKFYDVSRSIVAGDLFSIKRFKNIILTQVGYYDHLLAREC